MSTSVDSLLSDLRVAGHPVSSLADLVNTRRPYPEAIPVLVRWLDALDFSDVRRVRGDVEMVVRALAVPTARGVAAPTLIKLFKHVADRDPLGLGWAIGNSLEVVADDSVADDLFALATGRSYGRAREMVVLGLARLLSPRAEQVLIDLLNDEDVVGHAVIALGKRRSRVAEPVIARLLQHPKPWVRKEARKALARIQAAPDSDWTRKS
jgi:HEAT repeat protein